MIYCLPVVNKNPYSLPRDNKSGLSKGWSKEVVERQWETQDMALAVYLRAIGHKSTLQWRDGICFWKFSDISSLRDEISKYAQGEALIEPKIYNKTFAISKREMFSAPGNPRKKFDNGITRSIKN